MVSVCEITDWPTFCACCPVIALLLVVIVQVYVEFEGTTAPTIELGVNTNPASLHSVITWFGTIGAGWTITVTLNGAPEQGPVRGVTS